MEYKELMARGKRIFNFHPDMNFTSIDELLIVARKNYGTYEGYTHGASIFAETLARYIDENI